MNLNLNTPTLWQNRESLTKPNYVLHLRWCIIQPGQFSSVWQLFFIMWENKQEPKASKGRKSNPDVSVLTVCRQHQELVKADRQPGQLALTFFFLNAPVLSFNFNLLSCVSIESTALFGNFCWSTHRLLWNMFLCIRSRNTASTAHWSASPALFST